MHLRERAIAQRRVGSRSFVLRRLPKVTAATSIVSLWVMLEFKTGNVPAFVDTGAQFSCVRSDVIEFIYMREKPCTFSSFSVSCFQTDGQRSELTDAVKINIKFPSFIMGSRIQNSERVSISTYVGIGFP